MKDLSLTEIIASNNEINNDLKYSNISLGIISNITVNNISDIFKYGLRKKLLEPNFIIGEFDNLVQESIRLNELDIVIIFYDIYAIIDKKNIVVDFLNEEQLVQFKNDIITEVMVIFKNLERSRLVFFNSFTSKSYPLKFVKNSNLDEVVNDLNKEINNIAPNNINIVDIDKIISVVGIDNTFDFRMYELSKTLYKINFIKKYFNSIESIILKNQGRQKKIIIFDCDNTLWKGVIGEDGMNGIDMSPSSDYGKYFQKIQKIASNLSKRGVLIALCSKNEQFDVDEVINKHSDFLLKNEDIILKKINWVDKATNIKEITNELNIGLDSVVFVDDSSFEINLINEQLPEVLTIQVPKTINTYPSMLIECIYNNFELDLNLNNNTTKTQQYKEEISRRQNIKNSQNIDDYLKNLDIKITIEKNVFEYVSRISQLTLKTNQFNLTTTRYTEQEINNFYEDKDVDIYTLKVEDKFGDSGITGVAIIKKEIDFITIDTFLMSCRILGRNIEFSFLNNILNQVKNLGIKIVRSKYIKTLKNAQVESFFEKNGFDLILINEEAKFYQIETSKIIDNKINYINVN